MGGVKKKSMASMEKSQDSQSAGEETAQQGGKGKKIEKKSGPPQRKQLAFLPPTLSDPDLVRALTPLKAITVSTASRALGVNASIASMVIRDLESKSLLTRSGGFSGHLVWAVAKAA